MSRTCPHGVCDGSGLITHEETRTFSHCQCRPQVVAERRARELAARIPRRFQGVHIDRAPIKDLSPSVLAVLRRYIAELPARVEAGEGLWFYGPAGTGKTSAAMLVAKKGIECGIASAIYSAPQLLATLRSTFDDRNEQTHLGLVDRLSEVDLLQIDDLGAEKTSPWVLEQLYAIVNARYENRRATVITTNLERSMLAEQIGGRTVSRLEEMCEVLPVLGPDLRRRFGEAKPLLNYQMPEEGPRAA